MSRRNKLIWLLVALWLPVGFVPVAQADLARAEAAFDQCDFDTAFKEYEPLAEQGDAEAQFRLGMMYDYAYGVPQDNKESEKWYRKAAEQGHAHAQNNLGWMYYEGQPVPDYVLAHMWFDVAATQGDETAIEARDLITEKMTPDQIAEAQELAREWKPKE